jgi:hypothetical protein
MQSEDTMSFTNLNATVMQLAKLGKFDVIATLLELQERAIKLKYDTEMAALAMLRISASEAASK